MIPSAAVQHRLKHFDQLLAEELNYLQRGYEQNLVIYEKFEKSIRHDSDQIKILKRKKYSRTSMIDDDSIVSIEQAPSSIITSTHVSRSTVTNQKLPKFHRHCFKAQRLPPIVKLNREKRTKNEFSWLKNRSSANDENQPFIYMNDELPKMSRLETATVDERVQSFIDTLPPNKGLQKGFDNFAAAALYSRRSAILMK